MALVTAIMSGNYHLVLDFLDDGADLKNGVVYSENTGRPMSALDAALLSRRPCVVEVLLTAGANPDQRLFKTENTPLELAAMTGDFELNVLLRAGAKVDGTRDQVGNPRRLSLRLGRDMLSSRASSYALVQIWTILEMRGVVGRRWMQPARTAGSKCFIFSWPMGRRSMVTGGSSTSELSSWPRGGVHNAAAKFLKSRGEWREIDDVLWLE